MMVNGRLGRRTDEMGAGYTGHSALLLLQYIKIYNYRLKADSHPQQAKQKGDKIPMTCKLALW